MTVVTYRGKDYMHVTDLARHVVTDLTRHLHPTPLRLSMSRSNTARCENFSRGHSLLAQAYFGIYG
jgi:hypothetical protein